MIEVRRLNRTLMLICICLIFLVSIHCKRSTDRVSIGESSITVGVWGDEKILGPYGGVSAKFLAFQPLVWENEKGELEGRLATSWDHSPDYRTWTIHLRPDVRWHDGVPFTAHDVKFTMDLLAHPDVALEVPGSYTVTVINDSTFTITFHKSTNRALYPVSTWLVYYPKHLLKDLDPKKFYTWEFWTLPIGNGPYRYVRHVPKTMMEFEANPDYYRGKPIIERVILKFIGSTRLTELLSGNVDAAPIVRTDFLKLAGDPRFQVYHGISSEATQAIAWNQNFKPFRDSAIRRALTLAINRRELCQVLNLPDGIPIFDVPYTERQFKRRELPEPLPYDPERAEVLLEEAGWKDRDGNKVREKDGQEFRFTALVGSYGGPSEPAVYVQASLRRVGVRMEIIPMGRNVVRRRLKAGDFEAAFTGASNELFEGLSLRDFFGKDSFIGYKNSRIIELLDAAQKAVKFEERDALYRELMSIFQRELPVTYLFPYVSFHAVNKRIRGLSSPFRADPLPYMEDLWIEEEDKGSEDQKGGKK